MRRLSCVGVMFVVSATLAFAQKPPLLPEKDVAALAPTAAFSC